MTEVTDVTEQSITETDDVDELLALAGAASGDAPTPEGEAGAEPAEPAEPPGADDQQIGPLGHLAEHGGGATRAHRASHLHVTRTTDLLDLLGDDLIGRGPELVVGGQGHHRGERDQLRRRVGVHQMELSPPQAGFVERPTQGADGLLRRVEADDDTSGHGDPLPRRRSDPVDDRRAITRVITSQDAASPGPGPGTCGPDAQGRSRPAVPGAVERSPEHGKA